MTQGDHVFYLRELHPHWSTSNLSAEKLAELEKLQLIERRPEPFPVYRLTAEGARIKTQGRSHNTNARVHLQEQPKQRRFKKKTSPPPRRWSDLGNGNSF